MDLTATPPTNTKVIQRPGDAVRFYRVEEFPLPPVGVFEEHFDGANAGTLPTDWTTGFDPADTLMNTNWELGDPTGGPATGHGAADGLQRCPLRGNQPASQLRVEFKHLVAHAGDRLEHCERGDPDLPTVDRHG